MLEGKKTYLLAALTGLTSAVMAYGGAEAPTLIAAIGVGLSAALAALRHGVEKKTAPEAEA